MKKSFLSLALALILCLSLAVPAFAAERTVYRNEDVQITNVIDLGDLETDYSDVDHVGYITRYCICVAPVTVTPGDKYQAGDISWNIAKYPEDMPEDGDVTDLDWDTFADYEGKSVTFEEAGDYVVGFGSSSTEDIVNVHITVEPAANPTPGFSDVTSGDWFYEPVQWAVKEGITNGTSLTTFSPNQDCTVAHILTFLWRANGSPKVEGDNPFTDVKADDWFAGAALWAHEKGMVAGSAFNPNTLCTRSMAVKYLWQAAGSPSAKASGFSDVPAGADYAQAVNWAVEKGVTNGTSTTTFSPGEVCTRGHIVTFLYRDMAQ